MTRNVLFQGLHPLGSALQIWRTGLVHRGGFFSFVAACLLEDLTAAVQAEEQSLLSAWTAIICSGEDAGESRMERRNFAALRADNWASRTSGHLDVFLVLGGLDSQIVLKQISAARFKAWFVQSRMMEVRLVEEGQWRGILRRGRVEDRRVLYSIIP